MTIAPPDESTLRERTLDNGLRVILAPRPFGSRVAIGFYVKVGSRHEEERTAGLSHFLEHMLFRGTARHPSTHALARAIAELGGDLDAATLVDYSAYELLVARESAGDALPRLAEIFREPLFEGLGTEKRVIREELLGKMDEHGNDVDVDDLARRLLFGDAPLGRSIAGTAENVECFGRADLEAHLERFYVGRNAVLAIAGPFDADAIDAEAGRAFSALREGERATATMPDLRAPRRRFSYVRDAGSQTDLRLSYPTAGSPHPDRAALDVLARILDDGFASRVNHRICDERGLAYEAFASLELYEDCGVLDFGASVAHEKAPTVLRELFALAHELASEDVSEADLELARRRFLVQIRATADEPAALASYYGTQALFGLPITLAEGAAAVDRVDAASIRRVASSVFRPDEGRVACVGMLDDGLESRLRAVLEDERRRGG